MKAEEVRISEWEGYQRKDFKLDGHECILVMPKEVHPGKPWVWRAEFFGAFDYADRALLEKGWHIAYMMISDMYGCPESISLMEMFYQYITEEEGLNKKADLFGFSRGGLYSVNYTVKNPETISTLYLDAPVMNVTSWPGGYGASERYSKEWEECKAVYHLTDENALEFRGNPLDKMPQLLKAGIRIMLVAGAVDSVVPYQESPGWLKYRKSVSSDSEQGAVLEWQDEGAYCYGLNGEKFIDCLGGFGIYTCGHRNPEILKTVKAQLDHQALHSQELLDPLRGYLAKALADITPGDLQYCFFTNGGAEAVEMALKLARIATGGRWFISTVGAFHGKSMGAISMGGKSTYRTPYIPMVQQVQHVQYGIADDVRKAIKNLQAVGEKVAGVILEPIQGEAGVIVPPAGYLQEVREICDETGVALIFDEIQTGMGRTGTMWRCEAEGVTPDIMTYGKAFGGGIMPITGIICKPKMWVQDLIDNPWLLGSPTFGGNPVCCAAAIATIKYMLENDIPGVCKSKGEILKAGLQSLAEKYPEIIQEVRGTGLMLAVEFHTCELGYETAKGLFARRVMTAGTLVNAKTIRFEPTAVISEQDIKDVISRMDEALADTKKELNV